MGTSLIHDPLGEALFPKSRQVVLGLLFGHSDRAFYLREVVALTGLGVGQVQRELNRLSHSGILTREEKGKQVYFQANRGCPIFEEIRAIVTKTLGAATALRTALGPLRDRIASAFIFGSIARGHEREASDLDVLIVGEVTFAEVVKAVRIVEHKIKREINPSVFPLQEFRDKLSAENHFLKTVMKQEKIFLVGNEDELAALLKQQVDS